MTQKTIEPQGEGEALSYSRMEGRIDELRDEVQRLAELIRSLHRISQTSFDEALRVPALERRVATLEARDTERCQAMNGE